MTDENLIRIVEEVLFLFKLVNAKDMFEEFYQRGLMRRLLLKKSASYDSEKIMILKLKTQCGDQFIQKVEGMMKDLFNSKELMGEYLNIRGDKIQEQFEDIEYMVHVLSSNCWPISQSVKSIIPPSITGIHNDFNDFYKNGNQGKQIKYCIQMCTALIQAKFSAGNVKLFDVSGT